MTWIIFLLFLLIIVQPQINRAITQQRRNQLIRSIELKHGSKVITMIHRQERNSLFGVPLTQSIGLEDAQTVIADIKSTPAHQPIDLILHTPGGLVLAAMQIARAVRAHPAPVRVFVPIYAMSGGTIIALAADEIVLGEFSVLGPIDPQLFNLPAASIVKARDSKPVEQVSDLTLVLADMSEKALTQVKRGAAELMEERFGEEKAGQLAEKLAGGYWTHDYALTYQEAKEMGLPVKLDMPLEMLVLMGFYPQPVTTNGLQSPLQPTLDLSRFRKDDEGE